MTKIIVLVGLPCSGKSTIAQNIAMEYNATIFSSDSLRMELYQNVNDQEHNQELFVELHKRIKNHLKNGENAIYDATNISYKRRMAFLQELKNIPCEKICVLMATPYEECLKRNAERERKVPEEVINRMYMTMCVPYWYEGWDDIHIIYSDGSENSYDSLDWLESVMDYDQQNSHHTLTLGWHCMNTFLYLNRQPQRRWEITSAALIHDCGKLSTATFINAKGEETEECHYYNHQYTGSYDSLFFSGIDNHLYVAVLILWHMQPYFWERDNNEKQHNKYRTLWGEELYNDVMLLHEADLAAH